MLIPVCVLKGPLTCSSIKLFVFVFSQRLHISRHYPRGPVWLPAPKAAAQSDRVHRPAAGGPGENLPEDPLPRRGDAGTPGHVHQPAGGPRPGKTPQSASVLCGAPLKETKGNRVSVKVIIDRPSAAVYEQRKSYALLRYTLLLLNMKVSFTTIF